MYLFLAATGLFAIISPSKSVSEATGWGVYLWAAFLLFGGSSGLWGTVTDKWFGEYIGLIPLMFSFLIYSVILLALSPSLGGIALGCLLLAIGAAMLVRHREVSYIRRVATRSARNEEG